MAPSAIPISSINEGELTSTAIKRTINSATAPASSPTAPTTNGTTLAPLDASLLTTTYSTTPRTVPASTSPDRASTSICTDHMILCSWNLSSGWAAPQLRPYGPLSLMPTASVLHYATECFEGLKLYRGFDGRLRLFRPDRNCKRMLVSAARIALPAFDPNEVLKLIVKLCATDGPKWLPYNAQTGEGAGDFLYLRPTMIADDPALGVQKPKSALLYVIMTCFPRMDEVEGGMRLLASEEDTVRAWPGGFGYAKVGANYGPSLAAQGEARRRGFQQVLWLLGRDDEPEGSESRNGHGNGDANGNGQEIVTGKRSKRLEVTEAGASNFFVIWRSASDNAIELVTAPLGDRVILDGVTRRSVLELAQQRLTSTSTDSPRGLEPLRVCERKIYMDELLLASREGRLLEAFATGTAFFVSPVSCIGFRGEETHVPCPASAGLNADGVKSYTQLLKGWIADIMYGREGHEWGYVVEEEQQ